MLASNQPYERVSDGIGGGMFIGALTTAKIASTVDYLGGMGMKQFVDFRTATGKQGIAALKASSGGGDYSADIAEVKKQMAKDRLMKQKVGKYHRKAFGGAKQRAITYGASILGGAALGGGIDALN